MNDNKFIIVARKNPWIQKCSICVRHVRSDFAKILKQPDEQNSLLIFFNYEFHI